jgi:hypothetical protein
VFPNCKAVNNVYAHGIAKHFKVIKTPNGLTGRPWSRKACRYIMRKLRLETRAELVLFALANGLIGAA